MDRRQLLGGAAAVGFAALPTGALHAAAPPPRRRNRPGDPGWPDASAWERLRQAVGGRLIRPEPLTGPCAAASGSDDCARRTKNLLNPYFIGDQPAGTQVSGWLDAWRPAISPYAVAATGAADVAAAVRFARRHDLRLAVKGGGHSYQGTSNAPGSLLIWTRAMKDIELHDAFVPAGGGEPTAAVTVGAGCVWMDVYDAVTSRAGRYVQGGGCTTVGVAGLVQSGGFGSFSKGFGTAASGLLQAELVTADGTVRTVNARNDPELFWALKGGGGGCWGVVTRLTLKTHELPAQFGWAEATIKAASDADFARLLRRFLDHYAEALFNPHWGEIVSVRPGNSLKISMVSQGLDPAAAHDAWRPFAEWLKASGPGLQSLGIFTGAMPARGWWDAVGRRAKGSTSMHYDDRPGAPAAHAWWSGDQEQVSAFLHGFESVWLPSGLLRPEQRQRLADALFAASRHMEVELHFNKGLAGAPAEAIAAARRTATNPEVLDAFALAIVATGSAPAYPGFPATDMAQARRNAAAVDAAAAVLWQVAPRRGSYVSESNYFNPAWREAFWGPNYRRLRSIKQRDDPDGLFIVHHGVGSEAWSADGFLRLKA